MSKECPICGNSVPESSMICPYCGTSLSKPKKVEVKKEEPEVEDFSEHNPYVVQCPSCGWTVRVTNHHCPNCKYYFNTKRRITGRREMSLIEMDLYVKKMAFVYLAIPVLIIGFIVAVVSTLLLIFANIYWLNGIIGGVVFMVLGFIGIIIRKGNEALYKGKQNKNDKENQ